MNLPQAALYTTVLFFVSSCQLLLDPDEFSVVADAAVADAVADAVVIDAQPDASPPLCADGLGYEAGPPGLPNLYRRIDEPLDWEQARVACEDEEAHLVVIEDVDEADYVRTQFGHNLWIGLSDAGTEDMFEWVNGSQSPYRRWDPGEPNNGNGGGEEDYVEIIMNGNWNDIRLDDGNRPVCECPLAP